MKHAAKNLLVVGAGVVVLGGVLAALLLTGSGDGEETSSAAESSSSSSISLVSREEEDITSMEVTNQYGTYTIVPYEHVSEVEVSDESGGTTTETTTNTLYRIAEYGDSAPLNTYTTERVLECGFSLNATRNIGEVADLSEYGLTDPQATVKVNFNDGTDFEYLLGNENAGDGSGYYMCVSGSNNVYIVSVDDEIFEDKTTFINKTLLSLSYGADEIGTVVDGLTLSGTQYPDPIEITFNEEDSTYTMMAGHEMELDTDEYSTILATLTSLSADDVAYVCPTAEDLAAAGLDNPSAVVEFSIIDGDTYRLSAGRSENGMTHVMVNGKDAVYLVEDSKVSTWTQNSAYNMRSKFVKLPMITEVQSMTVTINGEVTEFVLSRTKDEEKSTEDSTVYNYEVTGNGKKLTYDDYFQKYYQSIIGIQLLEETDEEPTGEPVVTLTYHYYDEFNRPDDVISFYEAGTRRYLAQTNGGTDGLVSSTYIDRIAPNTEKMLNDERVYVN